MGGRTWQETWTVTQAYQSPQTVSGGALRCSEMRQGAQAFYPTGTGHWMWLPLVEGSFSGVRQFIFGTGHWLGRDTSNTRCSLGPEEVVWGPSTVSDVGDYWVIQSRMMVIWTKMLAVGMVRSDWVWQRIKGGTNMICWWIWNMRERQKLNITLHGHSLARCHGGALKVLNFLK